MKRLSKILLLTLILALSVFAAVSCSDDDVTGIAVKEDAMPQLQFVLGEDLDFSAGILVVNQDDTTTEIALNSEGVTVSGYNKDQLGEQTVTIEYAGQTTQLTVTVVPRMVAIDYESDYLVGDALNTTKGKLKITRNDGSTYTVPFSNASVSLEGFNSASASNLSLTARYTTGDVEYTASFEVNVYAVEEVELHRPNKVAYNSHEGGLDVSGGYLTLKGNGGKLVKDVTLTANMVSGFDLSAVNAENTPLNQTLTVTYDNKTYNYDVKLVYTDVSLFIDNASAYSSLVWTGTTLPSITADEGEAALHLIDLYLGMAKSHKSYISTSDALNVARAAMAYGYVCWNTELEKYSEVFGMSESGTLELICESYIAVKNSLSGLADKSSALYAIAPTLIKITDEFGKENLITDVKFSDCIVFEPSAIANSHTKLTYMTELYEKFDAIPENWANDDISTYEGKILEIYNFISKSLYNTSSESQLYMIVSGWRVKNDSFDILYAYYFDKEDMDHITALAALRLPANLQELFNALAGAFNQINQVSSFNVFDTSGFFYYYYKALALSNEIKNTTDPIIKDLYENLPLNGLLGITDDSIEYHFDTFMEYFRTANGGS